MHRNWNWKVMNEENCVMCCCVSFCMLENYRMHRNNRKWKKDIRKNGLNKHF